MRWLRLWRTALGSHGDGRGSASAPRSSDHLQQLVQRCVTIPLRPVLPLHPDDDIPLDQLQFLLANLTSTCPVDHPVAEILSDIVIEAAGSYECDVPIAAIKGMSKLKGSAAFNLAKAPEHMWMYPRSGDTFGPLNREQHDRLWEAIKAELGAFTDTGRIRMAHQTWDGSYIVSNTGAAHRFALWHRLQLHTCLDYGDVPRCHVLPAEVRDFHINASVITLLEKDYALYFCEHDLAVGEIMADPQFHEIGAVYLEAGSGCVDFRGRRIAGILLPRVNLAATAERNEAAAKMESWCSHLVELGRYLAERMAVSWAMMPLTASHGTPL